MKDKTTTWITRERVERIINNFLETSETLNESAKQTFRVAMLGGAALGIAATACFALALAGDPSLFVIPAVCAICLVFMLLI